MANDKQNTSPNVPNKGNVPRLRFPEFTEDWTRCTIGDYGNVITGSTPSTNDAENYDNGTYLWASPADLGGTKYIELTQTKLTDKGFAKTRCFPANSILVTCIGSTIGKMGMSKIAMSTNQQINTIVPTGHDANFVYYALQSRFPRYLSSIAVQAVPIISKSAFEKLENHTTQIDEQNKIGSFLSLLDERINTQNKIIEQLQSLIKGIVVEHYNKSHKTKVKIKDLGKSYSVMNMSKEDLSETGNECIIYGELFTTYDCVATDVVSKTKKSIQSSTISTGYDLLFPASTTVDAQSLIAPTAISQPNIILGGDMFGIVVTNEYNNEYLSYIFNYIYKNYLAQYAQGSTIIHLHYNDIKNLDIELPDIKAQNVLVLLLKNIKDKILTEKKMLSMLGIEKAYLLRNLFI